MRKALSIPLIFLVISAGLGVVLRWQFVSPTEGLIYGNWLHTHSHVMFLGWVFNFFNLTFVRDTFGELKGAYRRVFVINQILIVLMLLAFPVQGYGFVTIPLSIAHTLTSGYFCVRFMRDTRGSEVASIRLAKVALVFFLISSVGPFALGPIMANGGSGSKWYYFAIYFYLHFQYNGVFLFGLLSVFAAILQRRGFASKLPGLKKPLQALVIGVVLTYALSLLWAHPPLIWNVAGFVGAVLQVYALVVIGGAIIKTKAFNDLAHTSGGKLLVNLATAGLLLKVVLQLASSHPTIADMAYQNRHLVIAYLHVVLVGVISFGMIAWYLEERFVQDKVSRIWVVFLILGFVLSETVLAATPFIPSVAAVTPILVFSLSALMFLGFVGILLHSFRPESHTRATESPENLGFREKIRGA